MSTKKISSTTKKDGEITRSERVSATRQTKNALKNAKEKAGPVIHIAISNRTTIELPAHLTKEEIAARVERYNKLRGSTV